MKHNDNVAVAAFKTNVDRMQDYFTAAGIVVPRTHLLEAAARFQGARDWRTLRAELDAVAPLVPTTSPDIGLKQVKVYVEVQSRSFNGEGPSFCCFVVSQRWVNRIYELRNLCLKNSVSEMEDAAEGVDWLDDGEYGIVGDGILVSKTDFWYGGHPKHGDYDVEIDPLDIDKLIAAVIAAEGPELFVLSDADTFDGLMEHLKRPESYTFDTARDSKCFVEPGNL